MGTSKESSGEERRRYLRHSLREPAMLACPVGAFRALNGFTVNISTGGALLMLEARITVGSSVEVFVNMPNAAGTSSYPARCLGKVVRVEPCKDGQCIAVQFDKVEQIGTA